MDGGRHWLSGCFGSCFSDCFGGCFSNCISDCFSYSFSYCLLLDRRTVHLVRHGVQYLRCGPANTAQLERQVITKLRAAWPGWRRN